MAQAVEAQKTYIVQTQKTYIAEAQMQYGKTRAFWHDIKNHLPNAFQYIKMTVRGEAIEIL